MRRGDERVISKTEKILEARDASYFLGGEKLLDRLSFSIGTGRRVAIVGAHGSGKSLTMRMLHGLIKPSEGQLLWKDNALDTNGMRAQSMVFKEPAILRRTVAQDLRFSLQVKGRYSGMEIPEIQRLALARAGLSHLAAKQARSLTRGEQKRLAIARGLATDPEVLLLDEPTGNLEPNSLAMIEDILLNAHSMGLTIVLITQSLGQAKRLAQDVIVMHDGRIAETGPAEAVLSHPRSAAGRAWIEGRPHLEARAR
ncbi:MAG: tungstate transport system ATP-binding protein [Akkermansiaceae bacterium]|jgi:tungstate transport system ATP-binding protein